MNVYGQQQPKHPYDELVAQCGLTEWQYTMFYDMVPIDARPCQVPGSWRVQIIGLDGIPRTATRLLDGSVRFNNC